MTGSLLIVTGPPGAGKSTVSALLAARFEPSALVQGDAFFGFLVTGAVAPWQPEAGRQNEVVTRAAAAATGRIVDGGYRTVYDGVVGPWFLPAFVEASGLAELHYVVLLPPMDRCVDRVATRVGHGFADAAATRKMHQDFSAAAIDERHVLRDPPDGPDAVAADVLARLDTKSLLHRP